MRCHLLQCPGKDSTIVWEVMIQNKLFLAFWTTILTLSTVYFFHVFLLKKSWEDSKGADWKFCGGILGSDIFTTDNKVGTLGHHVTGHTLRSLSPASELTVSVKPQAVRQTPTQYYSLPSADKWNALSQVIL